MNYAFFLYMLYSNSLRYEMNPFSTGGGGTSPDYLYMLLFSMVVLLTAAAVFSLGVLSDSLLYVIMYCWSRRNPDDQVSMFGFKLKGMYLPWVYIAIRVLMGGDIIMPLLGIFTGHVYYFLVETLPVTHNLTLLSTPVFCVRAVEKLTGFSQQPQQPIPVRGATAAGGIPRGSYQWGGAGRTLGD